MNIFGGVSALRDEPSDDYLVLEAHMNDIIIGIIQGIVEGLTEFLPVSSTGHLILTGHLLQFTGERAETFEVVIQLGAILAIVFLYWRRLLRLIGVKSEGDSTTAGGLSLVHVVIACIPAVVIGLVFHDFIKEVMFSPATVLIGLVAGGIFMIYAENKQVKHTAKSIDDLSYKQVLNIGLAQCLALLLPGFSRSGATIAGGMLSGASIRASADFSFLIAVPMMVGASALDLYKSMDILTAADLDLFITGFVTSFVVAMIAVVSFLKLLEKVRLATFAYYRFALAAVYLAYMLIVGLE